jgi:hypothetical protein
MSATRTSTAIELSVYGVEGKDYNVPHVDTSNRDRVSYGRSRLTLSWWREGVKRACRLFDNVVPENMYTAQKQICSYFFK